MRLTRRAVFATLMSTVGFGLAIAPASAADSDYAPVDRTGPALTVPIADIEAAYKCHGDFSSPLEPVLFVPGTSVTVDQSFSWNYANYFDTEGRPYCTVQPPKRTQGDIQIAGEYIVHAIRRTYAQAGRPIGVLGHSQGGMSPRWALRFWPDTRAMVEDQIGMAPSNHGTFGSGCTVEKPCVEALWQQEPGSAFLTALNSRAETVAGIDYTMVYSEADERVPVESAQLTTGEGRISNVATQSICPGSSMSHLLVGTIDPVAQAVVMDALNHDGPADPARIDPSVCSQLLMPGLTLDPEMLNLLTLLTDTAVNQAPGNPAGDPFVAAEPGLRCYSMAAGCGGVVDGVDPDIDPQLGSDEGDEAGDGGSKQPPGSMGERPANGNGAPAADGNSAAPDGSLPDAGSSASLAMLLGALAVVVLGIQVSAVGRFSSRR